MIPEFDIFDLILKFLLLVIVGLFIFIIFYTFKKTKGGCKVDVYDKYNKRQTFRGTINDGKVFFKFNSVSRGGVSFEDNEFLIGKNKKLLCFFQNDEVLFPINISNLLDETKGWSLATKQEYLLVVEGMKSTAKRLKGGFWEQNKAFIFGVMIIIASVIVAYKITGDALNVTPVSEPNVVLISSLITTLENVSADNREVSETNRHLIQYCQNLNFTPPKNLFYTPPK